MYLTMGKHLRKNLMDSLEIRDYLEVRKKSSTKIRGEPIYETSDYIGIKDENVQSRIR